jgi:hypothetical protein
MHFSPSRRETKLARHAYALQDPRGIAGGQFKTLRHDLRRVDQGNQSSIYRLEPGVVYRVVRPFADYHGSAFEPGRLLTFESRSFVPYHGGHTLFFREAAIALQEDDQAAILHDLGSYLAVHDASGRRPLKMQSPPMAAPRSNLWWLAGSLLAAAASVAAFFIEKKQRGTAALCAVFFCGIAALEVRTFWKQRRDG